MFSKTDNTNRLVAYLGNATELILPTVFNSKNTSGYHAVEVVRCDVHGRLLTEPTKGINIIKMSNGTTRKELMK